MHFKHQTTPSVTSQWPLVSTKYWKISAHLSPSHTWDHVIKVPTQSCPLTDKSPPVLCLLSHPRYRSVLLSLVNPREVFLNPFLHPGRTDQLFHMVWCNPLIAEETGHHWMLGQQQPFVRIHSWERKSWPSLALNQLLVVRCHKIHISLRYQHLRNLGRTSWNQELVLPWISPNPIPTDKQLSVGEEIKL